MTAAAKETSGLGGLAAGLEQALKLVAGAGAAAAIFGLPAVALQHAAVGLPGTLIVPEQVLRAGVPPTALVGLCLLGAWLYPRLLRDRGPGALVTAALIAVPGGLGAIVLAIAYLLAVGWLCHVSLLIVAMVVRYVFIGGEATEADVPPWASLLVIIVTLACATGWAVVQRRRRRARDPATPPAPAAAATPTAPGDPTLDTRVAVQGIAAAAVLTFAATYALDWYGTGLGWGAPLGGLGAGERALLALLVAALAGGAVLVALLAAEDAATWSPRRIGLAIALGVDYAVAAGLLLALWTVTLYPALPVAFGGGRPEPVTLWLKADAVPAMALGEAPGCSGDDRVLRCDRVWLLPAGANAALLYRTPDGAWRGLAIPAAAILGQARRIAAIGDREGHART